ncbi:MAG: hypothetical protein RQ839_11285 [Thermoproteus sp.]|jgi:hypothetical protein|nr:hypothetical protein [Thermoproteus sp.]MDT7883133.1 hypothetical protein [Thermoproteus sp.]
MRELKRSDDPAYREEPREEHRGAVYEKALEIVERDRAVGSLRSADISYAEVFVEGRRHVVSVIGGGAQPERDRSGRTLLKITITAEVDGVRRDYTMAFSRRGSDNAALGYAYAGADAPGAGRRKPRGSQPS